MPLSQGGDAPVVGAEVPLSASGIVFMQAARGFASSVVQSVEETDPLSLTIALLIGMITLGWLLLRSRGPSGKIVGLYCFPVKSMRGIKLKAVQIDRCGVLHDRRYMVVQRNPGSGSYDYKIATAREFPRLATVQPELTDKGTKLTLALPTGGSHAVTPAAEPENISAELFRAAVYGQDQGDAVAKFLTEFLEADPPVRLMRCAAHQLRDLRDDPKYAPALQVNPLAGTLPDLTADPVRPGVAALYTDWSPLSIVSNQSLEWLNNQYGGDELDHTQFRTNIVVDAPEAFAEETWRSFKINGIRFEHLKRCGRCILSTINPQTGEVDSKAQPLLFLKRNRNGSYPWLKEGSEYFSKEGFFAVNIRHLDHGTLQVGDTVTVCSKMK